MELITFIGLSALGGALGVDRPSRRRKIPAALLPMVIRHLGFTWRNFHLSPCICRAPSWKEPCPWCGHYAPGDPGVRFDRDTWGPYTPGRLKGEKRSADGELIGVDAGLPWIIRALIAGLKKRRLYVVGWTDPDIAHLREAATWFEWPTHAEVWDVFTMRDRPPQFSELIPFEGELHRLGGGLPQDEGHSWDRDSAEAGYNRCVRLNGPGLSVIFEKWTPENKAEWLEWESREPRRRARRAMGHR